MESQDTLAMNRVILSHFDNYSAALLFARFGQTLLLPEPLSASAVPRRAPSDTLPVHAGERVLEATITRYGLNAAEIVRMNGFDEWTQAEMSPIRIHLLRFTTFLPPVELIARHAGAFAPISSLRGSARIELALARQAFNLILGGDTSQS
jgi:hypothetical protein